MPKAKVVQKPNSPEIPASIIAESIVEISHAMRLLRESRVTRDLIVVLIQDRSKVAKSTVNLVLNNLEDLERVWLKRRSV